MATFGTLAHSSPTPSPPLGRRSKGWARKCERYCCGCISYTPLLFVYGLTTWAVWVQTCIGFLPAEETWTGLSSASVGIVLYILLNWSYTAAVFTDPGSPINSVNAYTALPSSEPTNLPSLTVKSTGEVRFCKKCQTQKPDRAHHCSSCRRCVLKMDHHCPWLATCVGLYNFKPFLLFLIYTCLFCWVSFAVSATWVWSEILSGTQFEERLMPVNYVLLSVLGGIIGLVLTGFTGWHIYLASSGQTTIESLETTRYKTSLRRVLNSRNTADNETSDWGERLREIHANTIPGVTRAEEGEERTSPARDSLRRTYGDMELQRERERYESYLDEQDSEKLPNAFDLGWKRNLMQVFGRQTSLRWLPVRNTIGDGWSWEISRRWIDARELLAKEREARANQQEASTNASRWQIPRSVVPRNTSLVPAEQPPTERTSRSDASRPPLDSAEPQYYPDFDAIEANVAGGEMRAKIEQSPTGRYHDRSTKSWNDVPEDLLSVPERYSSIGGTRARSPRPRLPNG